MRFRLFCCGPASVRVAPDLPLSPSRESSEQRVTIAAPISVGAILAEAEVAGGSENNGGVSERELAAAAPSPASEASHATSARSLPPLRVTLPVGNVVASAAAAVDGASSETVHPGLSTTLTHPIQPGASAVTSVVTTVVDAIPAHAGAGVAAAQPDNLATRVLDKSIRLIDLLNDDPRNAITLSEEEYRLTEAEGCEVASAIRIIVNNNKKDDFNVNHVKVIGLDIYDMASIRESSSFCVMGFNIECQLGVRREDGNVAYEGVAPRLYYGFEFPRGLTVFNQIHALKFAEEELTRMNESSEGLSFLEKLSIGLHAILAAHEEEYRKEERAVTTARAKAEAIARAEVLAAASSFHGEAAPSPWNEGAGSESSFSRPDSVGGEGVAGEHEGSISDQASVRSYRTPGRKCF